MHMLLVMVIAQSPEIYGTESKGISPSMRYGNFTISFVIGPWSFECACTHSPLEHSLIAQKTPVTSWSTMALCDHPTKVPDATADIAVK